METKEDYVVLTGNSNASLAEKVGAILVKDIVNPTRKFKDGEVKIKDMPNVRDKTVYIMQSTSPPVNDSLMEMMFMIDAARRASAKRVVCVIPYFGYARQDRKVHPREPISSSVVANMLVNAGADHILTIDIHSTQIQGSIQKPWDNIHASKTFIPELKKRDLSNTVVVTPDKGGFQRATAYASLLGIKDIAAVFKQRDEEGKASSFGMTGDVRGKDVLIVDDMFDSGGTLMSAAAFLIENGARKVTAVITHGLFSGDALKDLTNSPIDEVIISDTVQPSEAVANHSKVKIVTIAPLLAVAIQKLQDGGSLSEL